MASKFFWRGVLIIALGVVSRAYFAFLLMILFGRVLVARRQENLPPRSFRDNECFPATDTVLPMNRPPWPSTHGAFPIARFDLTSQNWIFHCQCLSVRLCAKLPVSSPFAFLARFHSWRATREISIAATITTRLFMATPSSSPPRETYGL